MRGREDPPNTINARGQGRSRPACWLSKKGNPCWLTALNHTGCSRVMTWPVPQSSGSQGIAYIGASPTVFSAICFDHSTHEVFPWATINLTEVLPSRSRTDGLRWFLSVDYRKTSQTRQSMENSSPAKGKIFPMIW